MQLSAGFASGFGTIRIDQHGHYAAATPEQWVDCCSTPQTLLTTITAPSSAAASTNTNTTSFTQLSIPC
jgi:hypothetical protein